MRKITGWIKAVKGAVGVMLQELSGECNLTQLEAQALYDEHAGRLWENGYSSKEHLAIAYLNDAGGDYDKAINLVFKEQCETAVVTGVLTRYTRVASVLYYWKSQAENDALSRARDDAVQSPPSLRVV